MDPAAIRDVSAALFNNEKLIDVVFVIDNWDRPTFLAAEIAKKLTVTSDLVKQVFDRLERAGLIKSGERLHNVRRGPLPYELQRGPAWQALVALAAAITSH